MLIAEIIEKDLLSIEELHILESVKMIWSRNKDRIVRSGMIEKAVRGKLEDTPPFKTRFEVKNN